MGHPDAFNTLYAEIRFAPGILASLDGVPLGTDDSVLVTVAPRAGGYGLTLAPAGLAFAIDATPTVTFAYARYADRTPPAGDRYPTVSDFFAALDVWQETSPERWHVARGSQAFGSDELRAAIDAPGRLMVAAPR